MSDYLWDRSGEPDKEIQELEEILAPLGYQPRPLEIPATVVPERRRRFYPALAIAASIALAALALGLWLTINRNQSAQPQEALAAPATNPNNNKLVSSPSPEKQEETAVYQPKRNSRRPVHYTADRKLTVHRERRDAIEKQEAIATRTDAEVAEATKEQLMMALRLASTKLNHAQKRAQGGYPGNLIRNQHKVG